MRFAVGSDAAEAAAHHALSAPAAVFGTDGIDNLDTILHGAIQTQFEQQQHQPRGTATLNPIINDALVTFTFGGFKAAHIQEGTLGCTKLFHAHTWPTFSSERRGDFSEPQSIIGGLYLVRQTKDPGATYPRFEFLPWLTEDGNFK